MGTVDDTKRIVRNRATGEAMPVEYAQELYDYAISNPAEWWSDTNNDTRKMLSDATAGAFDEDIWANTPTEVQQSVPYWRAPRSEQQRRYQQNVTDAIDRAGLPVGMTLLGSYGLASGLGALSSLPGAAQSVYNFGLKAVPKALNAIQPSTYLRPIASRLGASAATAEAAGLLGDFALDAGFAYPAYKRLAQKNSTSVPQDVADVAGAVVPYALPGVGAVLASAPLLLRNLPSGNARNTDEVLDLIHELGIGDDDITVHYDIPEASPRSASAATQAQPEPVSVGAPSVAEAPRGGFDWEDFLVSGEATQTTSRTPAQAPSLSEESRGIFNTEPVRAENNGLSDRLNHMFNSASEEAVHSFVDGTGTPPAGADWEDAEEIIWQATRRDMSADDFIASVYSGSVPPVKQFTFDPSNPKTLPMAVMSNTEQGSMTTGAFSDAAANLLNQNGYPGINKDKLQKYLESRYGRYVNVNNMKNLSWDTLLSKNYLKDNGYDVRIDPSGIATAALSGGNKVEIDTKLLKDSTAESLNELLARSEAFRDRGILWGPTSSVRLVSAEGSTLPLTVSSFGGLKFDVSQLAEVLDKGTLSNVDDAVSGLLSDDGLEKLRKAIDSAEPLDLLRNLAGNISIRPNSGKVDSPLYAFAFSDDRNTVSGMLKDAWRSSGYMKPDGRLNFEKIRKEMLTPKARQSENRLNTDMTSMLWDVNFGLHTSAFTPDAYSGSSWTRGGKTLDEVIKFKQEANAAAAARGERKPYSTIPELDVFKKQAENSVDLLIKTGVLDESTISRLYGGEYSGLSDSEQLDKVRSIYDRLLSIGTDDSEGTRKFAKDLFDRIAADPESIKKIHAAIDASSEYLDVDSFLGRGFVKSRVEIPKKFFGDYRKEMENEYSMEILREMPRHSSLFQGTLSADSYPLSLSGARSMYGYGPGEISVSFAKGLSGNYKMNKLDDMGTIKLSKETVQKTSPVRKIGQDAYDAAIAAGATVDEANAARRNAVDMSPAVQDVIKWADPTVPESAKPDLMKYKDVLIELVLRKQEQLQNMIRNTVSADASALAKYNAEHPGHELPVLDYSDLPLPLLAPQIKGGGFTAAATSLMREGEGNWKIVPGEGLHVVSRLGETKTIGGAPYMGDNAGLVPKFRETKNKYGGILLKKHK